MHRDETQLRDKIGEAPGKRLLMEAALRLTSTSRSLSSLGLRELAREAGAEFNFEAIKTTPNTFDAHRLIHWAGLEGQQSQIASALFRAYWREGRDIGRSQVLVDIATECGLDGAVIGRLLLGDADSDQIRARERNAREKGITAVPTFIVADQYALSGAQPPQLWGQVIDELAAQGKA